MSGERITRVTTRGGDGGETSLADGARLPKDHPTIALIGEVDELNSWIGVARAHASLAEVLETLEGVQHDLFDLGGGLALPGAPLLTERHLARLDGATASLNADLPPLKDFILPGGSASLGFLHVARATARRVERAMAARARQSAEAATALAYLNRLSDYLFVAARAEARRAGAGETLWRKDASLAKPKA